MKKNDVVDGSGVVLDTLVMIDLTMSHYAMRTPYFVMLALVTCILGLIT
jgi:hypothetical protein